MENDFEKGDVVVILDRPMGHPSKIRGVIVGTVNENLFSVLLTNGFSKGKIKRLTTFDMRKEEDYVQ
mgnify:CR=1 FL=1